MHREPRNGASIDRIYLHKNEGPEQEGGAAGLASYLNTIDGGYHVLVDDKVTLRMANDDEIVWAEGGDNAHALSICLIGWSSETAAQYGADAYSQAEIERAAQQVAAWCKQYGVPVVHVAAGAPGQAPTQHGIALHADDHAPSSQGHTDPGAGFPIAAFVERVAAINEHVDWAGIKALVDWYHEMQVDAPLQAGESSWRVTVLKQLLAKAGHDVGNDHPYYGTKLVAAVHDWKVEVHDANTDGKVFGAPAAKLILGL